MAHRTNYASGSKWETIVNYSRAVRVGNIVEVAGTVALDEKNLLIGEGDPYLQTKFILQRIEAVLLQTGATLNNVVRTRLYVTDISQWQEYGRAHGEVFEMINPVTTMVEVAKLIAPEFLVEIEVTAIINES
jgi:enamine deaminase RidA (YjgF/YER057c/UK114 family)